MRQKIQDELDAAKTAAERNRRGQFSTPYELALDMLVYARELFPESASISFFDPGFGTGVFYSALLASFPSHRIERAEGFEIDSHYGEPALKLWRGTPLVLHSADFTLASPPQMESERYNLVICNPPYVRHHHILNGEKSRLQDLTKSIFGLKISGLAGLYCHFLALSHKWMMRDGVAGWLIPSEFMDVNYGKPVKTYLLTKVTLIRIHRFDPADVQFKDALVSSAVVWFRNAKPPPDHSVEFTFGGTLTDPGVSKRVPTKLLLDEAKWTRYPRASRRKESFHTTLGHFFDIRRGVATGDNSFFVLDKGKIKDLGLALRLFRPVLPSPRLLKVDEIFPDDQGYPDVVPQLFLLDCRLTPDVIKARYPGLWKYLELGRKNGVADKYLCRHRSLWYLQEIRPSSPFICTYMGRAGTHRASPFRFILNHTDAIVTNSYHILYPQPEVSKALHRDPALARRIWNVLNSIPPDAIHGEGRVYGGGLHKIEPHELSNVPAREISRLLSEVISNNRGQLELFA